jgi:uncharacterized protein YacL
MSDANHHPSPSPSLPPNPLEQVQQERSMLLRFVRIAFFILMVTVAMLLVLQQGDTATIGETPPIPRRANGVGSEQGPGATTAPEGGPSTAVTPPAEPRVLALDPKALKLLSQIRDRLEDSSSGQGFAVAVNWYTVLGGAIVFFLVVVAVDVAMPNKRIAAVSGVFLGTLTGILATVALSFVIDLVVRTWIPNERGLEAIRPILAAIKVMLGISLCYLAISTVMQTQDQFRLVIPYVEFAKQMRGVRPNLLDTSALIDARIVDVVGTGIMQSALIVPRFVVAELQLLADSGDRLKRARGRRGLDVVTRLQRMGTVEVVIDETPVHALGVDQMLVELAEKLGARIITTDLGLARVAQIKGLTAINLHDLANCVRPALVPGEQITIRLVKTGEQAGQGVGYLDDGTMVVADGGASLIGEEVALLVTSTMQTTAGRLVFARPAAGAVEDDADAPQGSVDGPGQPEGSTDRGAETHLITGVSTPTPTPATGAGAASAAKGSPVDPGRSGPSPKPGPRRGSTPSSARNPRRWPPAAE